MEYFFAHNRLSAYLDGDLSAPERAELERALEEDLEVAAALRRMRLGQEALQTLRWVKAPEGFTDRVIADEGTRAMPPAQRRQLLFGGLVAVAFAAALVKGLDHMGTGAEDPEGPALITAREAPPLDAPALDPLAPPADATGADEETLDALVDEAPVKGDLVGISADGEPVDAEALTPPEGPRRGDSEAPHATAWEKDRPQVEGLARAAVFQITASDNDVIPKLKDLAGRYGSELTRGGHLIDSLDEEPEFLGVNLVVAGEDIEKFQEELFDLAGPVTVSAPADESTPRHRVQIDILFDR